MNSDKHSHNRQRGNAMIYILLTLALIGALTAMLARQNDQGGDNINAEEAEVLAAQLMGYSAAARLAVEGMLTSGTRPEDISYVRPGESGYGTGTTINQLYHPDGGGFNNKPADPKAFNVTTDPVQGWYVGRFNNVDWTPTTANDIIVTAYGVKRDVCAAINKKITGSSTIPAFGDASMRASLIYATYHAAGQTGLTATGCPSCDGKASFCISNSVATGANIFAYYTVISEQ